MPENRKNRICPVENAGALEMKGRELLHNPVNILKPFVKPGMTVLDIGCGPGFFTLEMAKLTGQYGKVIAADIQDGMLLKLSKKVEILNLGNIIKIHKSEGTKIGITEKTDFILIFYMLHEVPDRSVFLREVKSILNTGGKALLVEPVFHVSKNDFKESLDIAVNAGFTCKNGPKIFLSRSAVLM